MERDRKWKVEQEKAEQKAATTMDAKNKYKERHELAI